MFGFVSFTVGPLEGTARGSVIHVDCKMPASDIDLLALRDLPCTTGSCLSCCLLLERINAIQAQPKEFKTASLQNKRHTIAIDTVC